MGVLAVVLAVAAGACGSDAGDRRDRAAAPERSSSVVPSVVTTATPVMASTPTPTASSTTAGADAACTGAALPAGATDTTTAKADVDGDGGADAVSVYRTGPAEQIASWHLRAELAAGGEADLTLSGSNPGAGAALAVIGGAKVDADGAEEIWARVGAGASRPLVGLFVLRSCRLEPVILNREPAAFPLGGTVRIQTGLECGDGDGDGVPDLVAYEAESDDGTTFAGAGKVYRLADAALTLVATLPVRYSAADPASRRYTSFSCGSLRL